MIRGRWAGKESRLFQRLATRAARTLALNEDVPPKRWIKIGAWVGVGVLLAIAFAERDDIASFIQTVPSPAQSGRRGATEEGQGRGLPATLTSLASPMLRPAARKDWPKGIRNPHISRSQPMAKRLRDGTEKRS